MSENWRQIPSAPAYEASDLGSVRGPRGPRVLRLSRRGYLRVNLFIGGRVVSRDVHQLVLEAFVGSRPEGMVCRHLNGVPTDNRVENLAWGTYGENNADIVRHGHQHDCRGQGNGRARLTEELVRAIRSSDRPIVSWARELGIPDSTIESARNGRSWRHL